MANIGDLEMTLNLRSNVEKELNKLSPKFSSLQKAGEDLQKEMSRVFKDIKDGMAGGLNTKPLEKDFKRLAALQRQLLDTLQGGRLNQGKAANLTSNINAAVRDIQRAERILNRPIVTHVDTSSVGEASRSVSRLGQLFERIRNYDFKGMMGRFKFELPHFTMPDIKGWLSKVDTQSLKEKFQTIGESISKIFTRRQTSNLPGSLNNVASGAQNAASGVEKLNKELIKSSYESGKTSESLSKMLNLVRDFAGSIGLRDFVMQIITVGGEIEKQHIALQSILGDLHDANMMFGELKSLALQSPFTFSDLSKDVKQLAAYGVEYNDLYDTTKRLADISAGLGVSFERIALAYGQVKSRSWLDGKELRQFAYAGVPLLQKLAEMYSAEQGKTINKAQVQKMVRDRQVAFEDVQKVLWDMTDEGGQFFNMQLTLSDTLLGRYNKLKDAWEIMLSGFAKGNNVVGGTLKTILNLVTQVILAMDKMAPVFAMLFSGNLIKRIGLIGSSARTSTTLGADIIKAKELQATKTMDNVQEAINKVKNPAEKAAAQAVLNQKRAEYIRQARIITAEDLKQLAAEKNLSKADLYRLYINKQITKEVYKETAAFMGMSQNANRLSLRFKLLGVNIANGLKAAGNSILGFFGGPIGIAITAATTAGAYMFQRWQEGREHIKGMKEEARDLYDQMSKFQADIPVDFNLDPSEMRDRVNSMREELKNTLGNAYGAIMANVDSQTAKYNKSAAGGGLRGEMAIMDDVRASVKKAAEMNDVFVESFEEAFKKTDSINPFSDNIIDNANKYAKTFGQIDAIISGVIRKNDWESVKKLAQELISTSDATSHSKFQVGWDLQNIINMADKAEDSAAKIDLLRQAIYRITQSPNGFVSSSDELSPFYKFGDLLSTNRENENALLADAGVFADHIKKELSKVGYEVTDEVGYLMYYNTMQSFFSQREVSKEAQEVFAFTLDNCMGLENLPSVTGIIAQKALDKMSSEVRNELGRGELLGGPSKDEMDKAIQSAYDEFVNRLPPTMRAMQEQLNHHQLFLNIQAQLTGVSELTGLQEWADTKAISIFGLSALEYDDHLKKVRKNIQKATSGGSISDAQKKNDEEKKKAKEEKERLEERKKTAKSLKEISQIDKLIADEEEKIRISEDSSQVLGSSPEKEKKTRSGGGSKKDYELEDLLRRSKAIERLINLYKELQDLYGADIARQRTNTEAEKLGIKDYDFGDIVGAREKLAGEFKALYDKAPKIFKDRREAEWQSADVKKEDEQRKKEEEDIKAITKAYNELNGILKSQYDLRKNIASKLGVGKADSILGSFQMYSDKNGGKTIELNKESYVKYLEDELRGMLGDVDLESALNMNENEIEKKFGTEGKIYATIKELRKERMEIQKEAVDAIVSQFESLSGTEAQLQRIDAELAETIRKINQSNTASDEDKKKAIEIAELDAAMKKLKMSYDYVTLFNNAWAMSSTQVDIVSNKIEAKLNKALKDQVITIDEYIEAMTKMAKATGYNELGFMGGSSDVSTFLKGGMGNVLKNYENQYADLLRKREEFQTNEYDAEIEELKETIKELQRFKDGLTAASDVIALASGVFDGLSQAAKAMEEMFDATGNEGMANFFSDFGDVMNIGTSFLSPADDVLKNALSGNISGIVSSIISAPFKMIAAPITGMAKLHDKRLEREIEASKRREKEMERLSESLRKTFEDTLGGGYSNSGYAQESYDALAAKREEMQKQLDLEREKKKKDKDVIADYEASLEDMDRQLKNHFRDLAKELYSIDVKGWASQLADAVVDAWSKGEDAAEAYRDKVKDIMGSVLKNVMAQKYMEKALDAVGIDDLLDKAMEDTQLDEDELLGINNALLQAGNIAIGGMTSLLENMKNTGVDIRDNGGGSGTLTSSIQNITESTAGILASYVNSIRMFVASDNAMFMNYFNVTVPYMNEIQESQLMQMQMIADNTYRNAESAARMEVSVNNMNNLFTAITNGTKRIYVN